MPFKGANLHASSYIPELDRGISSTEAKVAPLGENTTERTHAYAL